MSEKLLPCPFCGGEAAYLKFIDDNYAAQCTDFNCKISLINPAYFPSLKEAIDALKTQTEVKS